MKHIRKFEELNFSQTTSLTSVSDLTNYYRCEGCDRLFRKFNERLERCTFCSSEELEKMDVDSWFDLVEKRLDEDEIEYNNEIRNKEKDTLVDIRNLLYKNEAIGDTRTKDFINKALGLFLSPISLPVFANLSTEFKIRTLKKVIMENYIEEKAEYNILDEIKYDIEKPSELNKIFRRLKMISKKFKKYQDLNSYMESGFRHLKHLNLINFKNREDLNYIIEKVKEHFDQMTEEEWIKGAESKMVYSDGRVIRKKVPFYDGNAWFE